MNMNDVKPLLIYGIKLLQLEIFDVSYLFLYLAKDLQCLFNTVYRWVLLKPYSG